VNDDDKRKYPRMNTILPYEARLVPRADGKERQCRVSRGDVVIDNLVPQDVEDERLNMWLHMINAKLDYLISCDPPEQAASSFMAFEPLEVSGSGMMIEMAEGVQLGDTLEIRIVLQSYPAKILHLYGEVVRVDENPLRPDLKKVGLNFLNLNEEVRNEITKFDFKKHRQRLKEKLQSRRNGPHA
jgi:hypothetical protein